MNECQFDAACGIYRVTINCIINVFLIFYLNPWIAAINLGTSFLSVLIPRLFEKADWPAGKSVVQFREILQSAK